MSSTLNILALAPVPWYSLRHGTGLRVYHLLRQLSRTHRITLAQLQDSNSSDRCGQSVNFADVNVVECEQPASASGVSFTRLREAMRLGSPYPVSESMQHVVGHLSTAARFDVVLAFSPSMLRYACGVPGVPIVADLVDEPVLTAWRELRLMGCSPRVPRLVKLMLELVRYERAFCPRTRISLVVDQPGARSLRRIAPTAKVGVLTSGVDADAFSGDGRPPVPQSLLFSGTMDYPPNVAAACHFYRHIFPEITRACPTVRWTVAGANPAPEIRALANDPRVTVTGSVDDLRPYFADAAVFVSPLVSGGGVKNKVLEAWAMARPVVATPLGCTGLRVEDGRNIRIARSPREFAARTLELLTHPLEAAALGRAGRQTVVAEYSWDDRAAELATILQEHSGCERG